MTPYILSIIISWCGVYHIDPFLVMNIVRYESKYNPNAIGQRGEVGLMQLMPSSFPNYTRPQLFNPDTNVRLGVEYLSKVRDQCKFKEYNQFVICYNHGPAGANKVRHPFQDEYYKRVNK